MIYKTKNGLKFEYRPGCDRVQLELGCEHMFIPEYVPKRDGNIIDVGAHIGTFALSAALIVPEGKVYAIEPCQSTFTLLKRNIELNRLENILASNIALSDKSGLARLSYFPENEIDGDQNWGNTLTSTFEKGEIVSTYSLSVFLDENDILKCDFMKLNCEGSEFEIILGAEPEYLRRVKLILILYHMDLNKQHNFGELNEHLRKSGFNVTIRNKEKERGWIIADRY